jgi:tetratricopeptide (TPR) repeat protein
MKKLILAIAVIVSLTGIVRAESEKPPDPGKLFYAANALYEKRDYTKALEEYSKILELKVDSGYLYYNIGNCYFKLNKLGYAILFYEKARRLIPQDGDLKANLKYAQSLIAASMIDMPRKNPFITLIKAPFKDFSLNAIAVSTLIAFLLLIMLQISIIVNPVLIKKTGILYAVLLALLLISFGAFAIRYYDEEVLRRGIVVQKGAECKYEPIDSSTTFYRLQEGNEVSVIKTRDGWRQIKRIDGKVGWVRQPAVEEI